MASDEDTRTATSKVSILIIKVQNMLRRPQLNNDLSQALDAFMRELTVNNHYLRNGIFTMKFAEFGMFLQVTVELYSKQVDILWEDTLHYHVKLCSYNQLSPQNALEAEIITERINRNKRKKIVRQIVQNSVLSQNLLDDLERSSKVLQTCETITKSDVLKNAWKDANKNGISSNQLSNRKASTPLTSYQFSTHHGVRSLDGEKLGNYHDLFLTRITPYSGSFNKVIESDNIIDAYNKDFLLQRYLKHKGISYKKFCLNKLGEDFNFFKKRIQQIDALLPAEAIKVGLSNASIASITPLPEELMAEQYNESDDHLRSMIHDLLVKERQGFANRIKKSSERISDADSAFQDENFMDTDSESNTPIYTSQQSNVDSGIFENDLQDLVTSTDPTSECCAFESNVSNCINETIEDIQENIDADDIPQQDSILNSRNDSVTVDAMDTVENSIENNMVHSSVEGVVDPLQKTIEDDVNMNRNGNVPEPQQDGILNSRNDSVTVDAMDIVENSIENNTVNSIVDGAVDPMQTIIEDDVVNMNRNANRPEPVHITSFTVIKPLVQKEERPKMQKRKSLNNDEEDFMSPPKQRRKAKFKWLKTTTTSLIKFEKFFLQHYVAEDDEADPNREIHFEDDSEDECEVNDASVGDDNENLAQEMFEVLVVEEMPNDLTNAVELPSSTPVHSGITECTANIELEISVVCTDSQPVENQELPVNHLEIETTNRMKAINDWKSFIQPKLKKMEKSAEFDIHEYGSQIMDAIPEGRNLLFKNIVSGKSSSDVCKLFLASLQLANTSNIEIIPTEQGKLANDGLEFKLLTRERYHEYLEEYEAPSENSFRERLERVRASCPGGLAPRILNYSINSRSS